MEIGETVLQECLIALGGNLQITPKVFKDALAELQIRRCSDLRMSRVLKTRPVGAEAGEEFLNAAAVLRTNLRPAELLQELHEIETLFHRVRARHWGPRTLDLDLILYDEFEASTPQLVVPHPAMWYRRFVLEPAAEVAGHMIHPILNESVEQLYARLTCRPLRLEISGAESTTDSGILHEIMNQARDVGDSIEWSLTNAETCIAPLSFARIIVRPGAKPTTQQPFNRSGREIEVTGTSIPDVAAQIANLTLAMSG